jgi:hypothetical protein
MSDERDHRTSLTGPGDILAEIEAEVAHDLEEERAPEGGPVYQVVGAVVALGVGVAGAFLAVSYGLGTMSQPGAGLWPFVISLVVIALSLLLLVVGRHLHDTEAFTRSSLQPAIGAATFLVLGALMPVIGFELPALVMCIVWLRWLGGESWRSTIVVGVLTVAAFYFLFLYGLRIPLPHLF